jgi:hypothetical protein
MRQISTFFRFIRQEAKVHADDAVRSLLFFDSFSFPCGLLVRIAIPISPVLWSTRFWRNIRPKAVAKFSHTV